MAAVTQRLEKKGAMGSCWFEPPERVVEVATTAWSSASCSSDGKGCWLKSPERVLEVVTTAQPSASCM